MNAPFGAIGEVRNTYVTRTMLRFFDVWVSQFRSKSPRLECLPQSAALS